MYHIGLLGVLLLLIICTIEDIRSREIIVWHLFGIIPFFMADLLINSIFHSQITILERAGGAVVGILLMALSRLTKGQIGMGDAYLIFVIGIMLGGFRGIEILSYSLLVSAIASIVLLVFKHYGKKHTIPFVPFLLCGFMLSMFCGGGI